MSNSAGGEGRPRYAYPQVNGSERASRSAAHCRRRQGKKRTVKWDLSDGVAHPLVLHCH